MLFCGAGISYDAGIPLFEGLVAKTAQNLNYELSKSWQSLLKAGKLDQLYQLLECEIGREPVRAATYEILCPKKSDANALSKHVDLLRLATTPAGRLHLVTTNFDRLFDKAAECKDCEIGSYAAPLIPVPKAYKWDGVVYLHGKLDKEYSAMNMDSLVLSSGDFGVAYLTERWAARFVSELFREYVVCFVGYSVNDVIVRYMMDALMSERQRDPKRYKPVYAFCPCEEKARAECETGWREKGIVAIPYEIPNKTDHSELQRTLHAWCGYYDAGRLKKGAIVSDEMMRDPDDISVFGKDAVTRVLWALKDEVGASELGRMKEPPSFKWLSHLPDDCPTWKSWRRIVGWIRRIMGHPETLQWYLRHEAWFSDEMRNWLRSGVDECVFAEERLREYWKLCLSPYSQLQRTRYVDFASELHRGCGLTASLRQEFKSLIQPSVAFSVASSYSFDDKKQAHEYVTGEVCLSDGVALIDDVAEAEVLSKMMAELQVALVDACELLKVVSDDGVDYSYMRMPDLSRRTGRYPDANWYRLLNMLCEAWNAVSRTDPTLARQYVTEFGRHDYPPFHRLYLYASAHCDRTSPHKLVHWLSVHPGALWGEYCAKELLDCLDRVASALVPSDLRKLEELLLTGSSTIIGITNHERATRLEHLQLHGATLSEKSLRYLSDMGLGDRVWHERRREMDGLHSEEFWHENAHEHCQDVEGVFELPGKAKEYFDRKLGKCGSKGLRAWRKYCDEKPGASARLLSTLGMESGYWDPGVWAEAIRQQTDGGSAKAFVEGLDEKVFASLPDSVLTFDRPAFSFWLHKVASGGEVRMSFLALCMRFIRLGSDADEMEKVAQDGPYIMAMEAIMCAYFSLNAVQGGLVKDPFLGWFDEVVDGRSWPYVCACQAVFRQLTGLYLIDREWTRRKLLPRLSWHKNPEGALQIWNVAVEMSRYDFDLMREIWEDFAAVAIQYENLRGNAQNWYVAMLFHIATHGDPGIERRKCTSVLRDLPDCGRENVIRHLSLTLERADKDVDEVWQTQVFPFLDGVWPIEPRYMTERSASIFLGALPSLRMKFSEAVDWSRKRKIRCKKAIYTAEIFGNGGNCDNLHCALQPESALHYLSLFSEFGSVGRNALKGCLEAIRSKEPSLSGEREFRRLAEIVAVMPW